ncbi:hypothetical protein MCOR04_006165 [Pyricularia oryzae]|nr:hypothetical protein MCOR04_006165 [Pyricularia oryzae]
MSSQSAAGKITDWVKPGDTSGEFKRQVSSFRNWVSSEAGAQFPAEKGRYHLYVSYACPWATRVLIARKLKGLEDVISFSSVHWHLGENGWRFPTAEEAAHPDGENVTPDPLPRARGVYAPQAGVLCGGARVRGPLHGAGAVGQGAKDDCEQREQ